MHYVDQNGPYAEWKFDKRAALGDPVKEEYHLVIDEAAI
jgi:hypothetical protein